MNRWHDQFANHPIHETLRGVREFIETEHKNSSSEAEIEKRRFLKILDQITTTLGQIDPETIPFGLLDNLNNGIRHQNLWGQLSAYSGNGDVSHLTNANNAISAQLPTLTQLGSFTIKPEIKTTIKTIEKSADVFATNIDEKTKTLGAALDAIDIERAELKEKFTQLSSQFDTKEAEINQLASGWQQQFSDAQSERSTQYAEWRKEVSENIQSRVEKLLADNTEKLEEKNKSFSAKIDGYLADGNAKHTDILELHEIVAGDSVAAGYLQNAQAEKKQANFWRWASIIFIVGTAGWTAFSY